MSSVISFSTPHASISGISSFTFLEQHNYELPVGPDAALKIQIKEEQLVEGELVEDGALGHDEEMDVDQKPAVPYTVCEQNIASP